MDDEIVTVECHFPETNRAPVDLEIPLRITVNELIQALDEAYGSRSEPRSPTKYRLKAERPIALLRGDSPLSDFGLRNGSVIYYTEA